MKLPTKRLKNLTVGLKKVEKFVRQPKLLHTGKKIPNFGNMLPRELLANWLCSPFWSTREGRPVGSQSPRRPIRTAATESSTTP